MTTTSAAIYASYQAANPENQFNNDLIFWRERDDAVSYLEDIFKALEVVPGITFNGITVERDESKIPADLLTNDIHRSRLELAQVSFTLEMQGEREDITLSIFLPKLIDSFFYSLNASCYYPILQLVDRGTYITRKTFTLKTLLMPLIFRRDKEATTTCFLSGEEYTDMLYILDLFRNRINVLRYFFAKFGMMGTLKFLDIENIVVAEKDDVINLSPEEYRVHEIRGATGLVVVATKDWLAGCDIEGDGQQAIAQFRSSMMATLVDALDGVQRKYIIEDEIVQWRRRLGRFFTQNSNGYEEKADKILVSLERILDRRTQRNLAHVSESDKQDVYGILRWMMRDYKTLIQIDGMDIRSKRIRMAEYLIHPLLLKFSESTYRLLNSKNLTFRALYSVFKIFIYDVESGRSRPQANFLIKKLVSNELLRYSNMVNSFDLIPALRWTTRGPQSMADGSNSDISLRYRGHHPSFVGRVSLVAASASDPGTSGTLVPFCKTNGQFFV